MFAGWGCNVIRVSFVCQVWGQPQRAGKGFERSEYSGDNNYLLATDDNNYLLATDEPSFLLVVYEFIFLMIHLAPPLSVKNLHWLNTELEHFSKACLCGVDFKDWICDCTQICPLKHWWLQVIIWSLCGLTPDTCDSQSLPESKILSLNGFKDFHLMTFLQMWNLQ